MSTGVEEDCVPQLKRKLPKEWEVTEEELLVWIRQLAVQESQSDVGFIHCEGLTFDVVRVLRLVG